jgi:hypothetical protein
MKDIHYIMIFGTLQELRLELQDTNLRSVGRSDGLPQPACDRVSWVVIGL